MTLNELEKHLNAESAGGRLIVWHDGKKQYITDMNGDGEPFLNELGLMLHNAADAAVAAAVAAPKKREKKIVEDVVEAPVATSDDVQIEV
jgi:hypothetical protein